MAFVLKIQVWEPQSDGSEDPRKVTLGKLCKSANDVIETLETVAAEFRSDKTHWLPESKHKEN